MAVPLTTTSVVYGTVSDVALANVALTDAQLTELASTPPPVSLRDRGWTRLPSKVRLSAKSDRQAFTDIVPRRLATGAAGQRLSNLNVAGERIAIRLLSVEPARPWAMDRLRAEVEYLDGIGAGDRRVLDIPAFSGGVDRSKPPTQIGTTRPWNVKNVSFQGDRMRSRRGFAVTNNESDDVEAKPSAYYDATNAKGDTYHLVLIAGTLYTIDNRELIEIDTDWPQDELPTVATVGLKTFIACKSKVRVFQEGTIYTPGITAPTDSPVFVSSTPNVTGGVVALTPGYEYVYCFYDGTRLTESGPSGITQVTLPPGSTASSLLFSLGVSASTTVSERRLYRRKVGTDTWFLVATIADNTTNSVTDAAEVPPDINATLDSPLGIFVTAEFPDGGAVAAIEGRLLVWQDPNDKRSVRISEVGDGERFYPFNGITTNGEMRAAIAHEGRTVFLTDRTVEVVEGDWVRGSAGTLGIQKRILDESKGVFGPFAACAARGKVFFADASGIHVLGAGFTLKDTTQTISDEVQEIVAAAVDTAGTNVVLRFNYVSQELWVLLSQATGTEADPKNRVVLTINLENGSWSVLDHSLSYVERVFDGLLGPRFVGCDYFGNVLDLDVYDADGIVGDEAWLLADPVLTAFSATAKTVTVAGCTFPATIRGVSVILEDVSAGLFYRRTILSASGSVLTLDDVPTTLTAYDAGDPDNIIAGDKVWVGGILSYADTKELDGGRATKKKLTQVEVSFVDCTTGRF